MPLVCMICMAMSWSGVMIGLGDIDPVPPLTLLGLLMVRIGCFAAARGAAPPGSAGRRTAAGAPRAYATRASGSGLPSLQVNEPCKCAERGIECISRAGGLSYAGRTPADAIRWSVERKGWERFFLMGSRGEAPVAAKSV